MKTRSIVAALLLVAGSLVAQQGTIEHSAPTCIMGGEMPVFSVNVHHNGTLRCYFRRAGATDWCSIDGTNNGALSNVTLPKFETGESVEYYFALIEAKKVIAKSPQIYKTRATAFCENPFARHITLPALECLPPGGNPIATALGAGYATQSTYESQRPPYQSPDKPSNPNPKP